MPLLQLSAYIYLLFEVVHAPAIKYKIKIAMRKFFTLLLIVCLPVSFISAQTVNDLFTAKPALKRDFRKIASAYQALELNQASLSRLHQQAPAAFSLQLPFENRLVTIQLKKVKLTSDHFSVLEALPDGSRREVAYDDGIFYQGRIEGEERSFATISLFRNQVMGILADENSNIVLGAIEDKGKATSEYTLYRETDLAIPNPLNCFTSDVPADIETVRQQDGQANGSANRGSAVGEPVEYYFECDYRFYLDKGSSTTNVINYLLGFFNNTELLYANENVKVQVSQVLVWTTQDPEAAAGLNTTGNVLPSFASRMASTNYIGDYACFLSTRSLGGGVAYLTSNACTAGKYYRTAVCGINNTYLDFPTYSWTVEVVTHEIGHNLGSNHTHWCGWPGGAIDWCGPTYSSAYIEGSCSPVANPSTTVKGTIMSYCHLLSVGINFNNGFGPLPGQKIRDYVAARTCFASCRMTISISKIDASCGSATGSATVTVTNNTGAVDITWSNGQTGPTLVNAAPGTYYVTVKDGSSCQVMDDVVIVNTGSTLSFNLTPATPAAICAGGTLLLTATSNPSFTYQWFRNGTLLNNVNGNTYMADQPGTYEVRVTAGSCTGTKSVTVTQVSNPTVTISPASSTIEKFESQTLSATGALSYDWDAQPALVSFTLTQAVVRPLSTTSYIITGTDINGCKGTATAVVNVIGCGTVTNIKATAYSPSRVLVEWQNPQGATADTLLYRVKGTTAWSKIYVNGGASYELSGLQPATDYEYAIIPLCTTTTVFLASAAREFRTAALEGGIYIRLFPNPVTSGPSQLEVIADQPYSLQVGLFDNSGRLVLPVSNAESLPAGQSIKTINAGTLPNGVYYLSVVINGKAHPVKMLIVR